MTKRNISNFLICIFLGVLMTFAQEPHTSCPNPSCPHSHRPEPPEEKKEIVEGIESIKLWRLTEELQLTEDQAAKFFPKMRQLKELKEERHRERIKQIGELAELLSKKVKREELKKKIGEIKKTEKEFEKKEEKLREEIAGILTVEQEAKFIIFMARFEGDVRRIIEKIKGRRKEFKPKRWR